MAFSLLSSRSYTKLHLQVPGTALLREKTGDYAKGHLGLKHAKK